MSTFSTDQRFRDYLYFAKRTGKLVGPGSYNENIAKLKTLKGCYSKKYKNLFGIDSDNSYAYVMVGHHTIYDPAFRKPKVKSFYNSPFIFVDANIKSNDQKTKTFYEKNSTDKGDIKQSSTENSGRPSTSVYGCSSSSKQSLLYQNILLKRKSVDFNEKLRPRKYLFKRIQKSVNQEHKPGNEENISSENRYSIHKNKVKEIRDIYSANLSSRKK